MAINKNFVIKNGVEVNSNLIVGDSDTNRVGVGTTVPEYTLHVAGPNGIGATNLNVVGVGTIQNLRVVGVTTLTGDVTASGIVSANQFQVGVNTVVTSSRELQNITALDSTTTATIEEAIRVGPNSFSDLKVSGISTFVGIASFLGGIDVNLRSGVSTFSAPVQFGMGPIDGQAGLSSNFVAVAATVGFGTSAFFRDNAAIFMGDGSDFRLYHDNTNSYIDNMTGDLYVRNNVDDDTNKSIIFQAKSGENSIVMTNSADESNEVELYYDGAKKLQTTSGGIQITGIATLTDRLHVQAGVSTFDADVRFGIGATVGFGTSAFFKDDAAIWLGDDSDLEVVHTGGVSKVKAADLRFQTPSDEEYIKCIENAGVSVYYDNSKKLESTSGGLNVTGITTFSDRINVVSGVSTFQDSAKLTFGAQSDLIVWHDGTHSYISDTTGSGNIYLDGNIVVRNTAGNETQAVYTQNAGVSLYYDNSKKVETTSGGLNITGITTFSDRINVVSGVSTFADSASLTFGTQGDLSLVHDGTRSIIKNITGDLDVRADAIRFKGNAASETLAVFSKDAGVTLYYDDANVFQTTPQGINVSGVTTSNRLYVSGIGTFIDDVKLTFGNSQDLQIWHNSTTSNSNITAVTGDLYINANASEAGVVIKDNAAVELFYNGVKKAETTADGILVGSLSTIQGNGNASFAGIVTVGGNLNVTGDIVYDEVSGRNINITGITTLGSGNGGVSGLLVTGAGYVGGGATVGSHAGIITYYGDGANLTGVTIGIGTTGDGSGGIHPVGYGVTYLEFKGAGFTTAYYDGNLGIATLCFQGGGTSGAAGTWAPYGEAGVATSKSVGVGTIGMGVTSLQGGVKGASSGIGNSFHGLYIGNGMMVVDNTLNGNHYIGTAYNGLMAGPVTINGVLTVDGNYVVV